MRTIKLVTAITMTASMHDSSATLLSRLLRSGYFWNALLFCVLAALFFTLAFHLMLRLVRRIGYSHLAFVFFIICLVQVIQIREVFVVRETKLYTLSLVTFCYLCLRNSTISYWPPETPKP